MVEAAAHKQPSVITAEPPSAFVVVCCCLLWLLPLLLRCVCVC